MPLIKTTGLGKPRIIFVEEDRVAGHLANGGQLATERDYLEYICRQGRPPEHFTVAWLAGWARGSQGSHGYPVVANALIENSLDVELSFRQTYWAPSTFDFSFVYHPIRYGGRHNASWVDMAKDRAPDKLLLAYSMYETTRVPPTWIETINEKVDVLCVPTEWQRENFRKNGVTKPIEIVTHGFPPSFEIYERPEPVGKFRFLHYNASEHRKGFKEAVRAFMSEFGKDEPVELILKYRTLTDDFFAILMEIRDAGWFDKIVLEESDMNLSQLNELINSCHCGVFLSKGEGFSLPPLECLATGLPIIHTNAHAHTEWSTTGCYPVKVNEVPAEYGADYYQDQGDYGTWFEADIEDTKKQMRFVYENWQQCRKEALEGAKKVRENFTWKIACTQIKEIAAKYKK